LILFLKKIKIKKRGIIKFGLNPNSIKGLIFFESVKGLIKKQDFKKSIVSHCGK
jgi:hypothetical protein